MVEKSNARKIPVKARRAQKRPRARTETKGPIRRLTDRRLDFPQAASIRASYIVASTERSGSTFLCSELWKTGVLGAPAEYWNYRNRRKSKTVGSQMKDRLAASSPAEYLTKLRGCRTSTNGVFGVNVHYVDFAQALAQFPEILHRLSPVRFIYIQRNDKLAQAVSMVKAAQTGAWVSHATAKKGKLRYNAELITDCLRAVDQQERDWAQWFETNGITPFRVTYEELAEDSSKVVADITEYLGAQDDEPQAISLPQVEKQSDETSQEWIARYRQEAEDVVISDPVNEPGIDAEDAAMSQTNLGGGAAAEQDAPLVDRFDAAQGMARPIRTKRLRHRYDAIVGSNRTLFDNAKVLDLHCGDGLWSLAALDAGASSVVGIDSQQESIETAREVSTKLGVAPDECEFVSVNAQVFAKVRTYAPKSFDVVICQDLVGMPDLHFLFKHLHRLQPKHVILDTAIVRGKVPFALFKFEDHGDEVAGPATRPISVSAVPNHELIRILCSYFGFTWRLFDWQEAGISDWTGVQDYERDRRRTYVLDLEPS